MESKIGTRVAEIIWSKHPNPTSPSMEVSQPYIITLNLINLDIMYNIINRLDKMMQVSSGLGGIDAAAWWYWSIRYVLSIRYLWEVIATFVWWIVTLTHHEWHTRTYL